MFDTSERISAKRTVLPGTFLLFVMLVVLSPAVALAQSGGGVDQLGTGGRHTIQGRIYFPSGRRSDVRVKVRLENFNAGDLTVLSDSNGSFTFRGLEAGSYTVVVEAGEDYQIAREGVYIDTDGVNPRRGGLTLPPVARIYTVQVSLQLKTEAAQKAGVINAALAAAPEKALASYRKAREFIAAGNTAQAIEQLNQAITLFPEFAIALNELGVQYLKKGELEKAADAFKRAVKLTPQEFQPLLNYGIVLLNQRKFAPAEEQLRASVKANNNVPTAHLYLGIVLSVQRKLDEGQSELESALKSNSPEVALAHRYLGGVLYERREYSRAAAELETYLRLVPTAPDRETLLVKIREWRNQKK
jgi:Tfp pilus assembly protein PilF